MVSMIHAQLPIGMIHKYGLELRYEQNIREFVLRHLLDIVKIPRFLAEGTDVKIEIFSHVCNT